MSKMISPDGNIQITGSFLLYAVIFILLFSLPAWIWFGWRIEPQNGQIAVLIRKTGNDLPTNQILATDDKTKGIQLEVLPEGRFFRNPYTWDWQLFKAVDVPAGKFGVLIRKFGKNLPGGELIAPDDSYKGIVQEVLGTGKHRINPFAYEVRLYDDIRIKPGNVGVVTRLCGKDILQGDKFEAQGAGFLMPEDVKGVQEKILKEGTHRLNPFIFAVSIVNIQSQRFELSGDDAISFLTQDGFTVTAEGTLEFSLDMEKAALLTHEVGDMDDILQKLILPSARGFSRIEGSKKYATEFIVGESRQAFQNSLEAYLQKICKPWGVTLHSVLIRDIFAPQEIAEIIRDREIAVQEAKKIEQQIAQAKSQAELGKQKALADQNSAIVKANTSQITQLLVADQKKMEKTLSAQAQLDVAKIDYTAAQKTAESTVMNAEAQRKVIEARTIADATVLKQEVEVYSSDADYVKARLFNKLAPKIESILTTDSAKTKFFGLPLNDSAEKGGTL